MIDVIILTSSPLGFASVQLNELVKSNKIRVKGVVLSEGQIHNKKKYYIRKIKKTLKIGVFGAINGIKMRKWYSQGVSQYLDVQLIDTLCKKHNIPLFKTPTINCTQTAEYFKEVGADLGLSLGNGYIGKIICI